MVNTAVEAIESRLAELREGGLADLADMISQYHREADNARRCESQVIQAGGVYVLSLQQDAAFHEGYGFLVALHEEALARAGELLCLWFARSSLALMKAAKRTGLSPADVGLPPDDLDDVQQRTADALAQCRVIEAQDKELAVKGGDATGANADQRLLIRLAIRHDNSLDNFLEAVAKRGTPIQLSLASA